MCIRDSFLPVTLEEGGARLEDGTVLPVLTARRGPAVLGIRPEHFVPDAGGLAAHILLVEPLGADTLVHFSVGAVRCIARVAPDTRPRMGETLRLGVAPGKAFLFDPESGMRLT